MSLGIRYYYGYFFSCFLCIAYTLVIRPFMCETRWLAMINALSPTRYFRVFSVIIARDQPPYWLLIHHDKVQVNRIDLSIGFCQSSVLCHRCLPFKNNSYPTTVMTNVPDQMLSEPRCWLCRLPCWARKLRSGGRPVSTADARSWPDLASRRDGTPRCLPNCMPCEKRRAALRVKMKRSTSEDKAGAAAIRITTDAELRCTCPLTPFWYHAEIELHSRGGERRKRGGSMYSCLDWLRLQSLKG